MDLSVKQMERHPFNEIIGSTFGILGSLFVSLHMGIEILGYACYFISNVGLLHFAWRNKNQWLLIMYVCFTATTLIGLSRW